MTQHPYVGLAGVFCKKHCIIVAIGQGGSTNEEGCAYTSAIVLNDDDTTNEGDLAYFVADDPTEARRRMTGEWGGPDAYQGGYTLHYPAAPSDKPTDGHEPCGPWRLVTAVSVTDPGYHPSDPHQATMFVFERPLRRVPRG